MIFSFVASIVVAIIGSLVLFFAFPGSIVISEMAETGGATALLELILTYPLPLIIAIVLIWLAMIFLGLWSNVAALSVISQENLKIKQAISSSLKKITPYFWISLMSFLLVIGAFGLFFIPGVIFAIWFLFSTYVFIGEGRKGMSALFRSKQLMKRMGWTMFWRLLVVLFVLIIVSGIASSFPMGSTILGFIITPLFHVFMFSSYKDIAEAKKDIAFEEPKKSEKWKIIIPSVLGYIIIIALMFTGLFLTLGAYLR